MAEAVVEHLEFINIDQQDRKLVIVVPLRHCDRTLQAIQKQSPIRKVGQAIVESSMLQQRFRPFAFGNVPVDDHQSFRLATRAGNRARGGFKHMPGAVFVADAVFQTVTMTRQMCPLGCLQNALPVFRVDLLHGRGRG